MTDKNNHPQKPHSYLSSTNSDLEFTPPVPEARLSLTSSKLVFSTRLYPEWMAGLYGVLKRRYPSLGITSASEMIQLAVQLLLKDNFQLIDNMLPPTLESMEFLLRQGFLNPNSERQFKKIAKAHHLAQDYEQKVTMKTAGVAEKIRYWEMRDPEKAKEIRETEAAKATELFIKQWDARSGDSETPVSETPETIVTDNTGAEALTGAGVTGAGVTKLLDYLNQVKTTPESDAN